jgi:4-amino-4-deoxy-L-arabinose transferase-like glycosyltransferase
MDIRIKLNKFALTIKPQDIRFIVYALLFIAIIAFKVNDLRVNPQGFFADEASIGYNAYTILTKGVDEFGNKMPVFFKSFGEYKNPAEIYTTLPFVALFGLNEFSVRLASLFFSILTGIVFLFIGKKIKSWDLGAFMSILFLIIPWSFHLGRTNMSSYNVLIFLLASNFLILLQYFDTKNIRYLYLFSIVSGLGCYTYYSSRIIFPIIFLATTFFIAFSKKKLSLLYPILPFALIALPLALHTFSGEGLARFNQTSVFSDPNIQDPIGRFFTTYIRHFSPDYLFEKGDDGMPGNFIKRHAIGSIGQLFWFQLPLIFLGFVNIISLKKWRKTILFPLIVLFIIYPIPTSITTQQSPHAVRSFHGVILFMLLTGFGTEFILRYFKRNLDKILVWLAIFCLAAISFNNLLKANSLYTLYSADYWGWQYGPREIISYFKSNHNQYDELYLIGKFNEPGIFYKFYDPEKICSNCFIGEFKDSYQPYYKQLFSVDAESFDKIDADITIVKTIYYPNGSPAFYLFEVKNQRLDTLRTN